MLLLGRLRDALARLNPEIPAAARDDALKQVTDLGTPSLLAANQQFHRLLTTAYRCSTSVMARPEAILFD